MDSLVKEKSALFKTTMPSISKCIEFDVVAQVRAMVPVTDDTCSGSVS